MFPQRHACKSPNSAASQYNVPLHCSHQLTICASEVVNDQTLYIAVGERAKRPGTVSPSLTSGVI